MLTNMSVAVQWQWNGPYMFPRWAEPLSSSTRTDATTSASLLRLLSEDVRDTGLCLIQLRRAFSLRSPILSECSAQQPVWIQEEDTCFGCVSGEKMAHFSYERQALLLGFRHWLPSGQTASVPCQGRDQSFSCTACDLCVAFHQSWGFRAHRNQPKQQDVHRFTDTQETQFFRAQLCFSGFFLLHFSVKRNSTTVVNYLWGWVFFFSYFFFEMISFSGFSFVNRTIHFK